MGSTKGDGMRSLVLLSGGVDSTAAAAIQAQKGALAAAVTMHYGQRHAREIDAAVAVARYFDVPHLVVNLAAWGELLTTSALTNPEIPVPRAHYAPENLALTVVPNRNATFLMAASGIAQAMDIDTVVTAVHTGDHAIYPDCRPEFIESASRTAQLGTGGKVNIEAPFVHVTKAQIVELGDEAGAPWAMTWSCYEGGDHHCGTCATCRERRDAFTTAGVDDPTTYAMSA